MTNNDPIVPSGGGLQSLPFIREKLFSREGEQAPPTVSDHARKLLPGAIPLLVFAWTTYDSITSGTQMLTPVKSGLLFALCGLGAFIGIPTGIKVAAAESEVLKILTLVLLVPAVHIAAFNSAAWRIANHLEFGDSSGAFNAVTYPVKSAQRSKSGTGLFIDPFATREDTRLPTLADPDAINAQPGAYCVTVHQRQSASGAVQMLRSGYFQPYLCSGGAPISHN